MRSNVTGWRPVVAPVLFCLGALLLTRFVADDLEQARSMARGIAGPITWPTGMLYGVALFALMWTLQAASKVWRDREDKGMRHVVPSTSAKGARVWLGIALVLAYGFLMPVLGFAAATAAYLALWLMLGGIRSPKVVLPVTILGTALFLYTFVKLALMPLDRGYGWIGEWSVALYRLMGIY